GEADPRLAAAVRAHAADAGRLPEVLAALHRARVLAPVVARVSEPGTTGDKTSDIALPLLEGHDGRRAVPVFSDLATLARWEPAARPVPVPGRRAAAVALAESAAAIVLDVAGPLTVTLAGPELRALAEGRAEIPSYDDEGLARRVARTLSAEPDVLGAWIAPWAGADARLTVVHDATAASDALAGRLAADLRRLLGAAGGVRGLELTLQVGTDPVPPGRRVFTRDAAAGLMRP
ncbi:MAG: SseB family protein, partial [Actinomycetes bacterium]